MPATPIIAPFPATRLRRLRRTPALRALTAERHVSVENLIWPIFVMEGTEARTPVGSMPGVERLSVDQAVQAQLEDGLSLLGRQVVLAIAQAVLRVQIFRTAGIGAGTLNPTLNQAQLSIVLADRSERENVARILPRLQQAVAGPEAAA
mgnify:CR=1 FL=1